MNRDLVEKIVILLIINFVISVTVMTLAVSVVSFITWELLVTVAGIWLGFRIALIIAIVSSIFMLATDWHGFKAIDTN